MRLGQAHMRFSYADSFGGAEQALDAYERLIHDVMVGDRTLFTTSEAIERLWEVSEPRPRASRRRCSPTSRAPGGPERSTS